MLGQLFLFFSLLKKIALWRGEGPVVGHWMHDDPQPDHFEYIEA